jgi:NhaP-type Na+/H+ or K+/H+ antiporter
MGGNAGLAWTLSLVFTIGAFTYALNRRVQISTVPVLLLLGVMIEHLLGLIALDDARGMFDQLRVIGLVIILFTAGFSLQWPVLHRHLRTIVLLDTIGLLGLFGGGRWTLKQTLFIGLEGPRGIGPAALAGLPLSLGIHYHNPELIHWGGPLLTSTLICIFVSVILCTSWMGRLGHSLGIIHETLSPRSAGHGPESPH